jgi:hypothetical protein
LLQNWLFEMLKISRHIALWHRRYQYIFSNFSYTVLLKLCLDFKPIRRLSSSQIWVATLGLRTPASAYKSRHSVDKLKFSGFSIYPCLVHILFSVSKLIDHLCNPQFSYVMSLKHQIIRTSNTDIDKVAFWVCQKEKCSVCKKCSIFRRTISFPVELSPSPFYHVRRATASTAPRPELQASSRRGC